MTFKGAAYIIAAVLVLMLLIDMGIDMGISLSEQEAADFCSKLKSYFRLVCHHGGPTDSKLRAEVLVFVERRFLCPS